MRELGPKLAKEYLARYGITLVIEKHFKRTFLDGAAMLDGHRPIVALTLRHDRIDNF
jgi:HTH-type transcriptional regulator/antitoxin HigA